MENVELRQREALRLCHSRSSVPHGHTAPHDVGCAAKPARGAHSPVGWVVMDRDK